MDPWRSEFGIFLPGSSGGAEILPGKVREVDPATDVGLMRLAGHAVVLKKTIIFIDPHLYSNFLCSHILQMGMGQVVPCTRGPQGFDQKTPVDRGRGRQATQPCSLPIHTCHEAD